MKVRGKILVLALSTLFCIASSLCFAQEVQLREDSTVAAETEPVASSIEIASDQSQEGVNYSFWFDDTVIRWQEFRPGLSSLARVDIFLSKTGAPGNLRVAVKDTSENVLWEASVPGSEIENFSWVEIVVSPAIELTPDTSYYIHVWSDSDSPSPQDRYFWRGQTESDYDRGISSVESAWPGYDFAFRTWAKVSDVGRACCIYAEDLAAAESFESLLEANGFLTTLIPISNVAITNFSLYDVIIVGSDTGSDYSWGDAASVAKIQSAGKPVLGLGFGGACLFERMGLSINWGNSWIGYVNSIYVPNRTYAPFTGPHPIEIPADGIIQLYTETEELGEHAPYLSDEVLLLGREPQDMNHYPFVQEGEHLLWGFTGCPDQMTQTGKALFINTVTYMVCPLLSAWATITPILDGVISPGIFTPGYMLPGEWSDAARIDFTITYTDQQESHKATLFVKNDFSNLYLALIIRDEEHNSADGLHFNFDNDNDGTNEPGDNQLYVGGGSNFYQDLYYYTSGSTAYDTSDQGTNDGVGTSKHHDDGTWVFEIAYPLNTADDGHDFSALIGDTLPFNLFYWDSGGSNGLGIWPGFDWSEMADIVIAGPPTCPQPSAADLTISNIEVTQAIQYIDHPTEPDNSLPLVRGKSTAVRVYVDIGDAQEPINYVTVLLYGFDGEDRTLIQPALIRSIHAVANPDRGNAGHSANFVLPNDWVDRANLRLRAFVKGPVSQFENNYDNNWMAEEEFALAVTRTLNIYEVPVNTGTSGNPNLPTESFMQEQEKYLQKIYPVSDVNFIRLSWEMLGPWSGTTTQLKAELNRIAGEIVLAWIIAYAITGEEPDLPLPDQVYGFRPSGGGTSDPEWAGGLGIAACGGPDGSSREGVMAHEIIHNLGPGDCADPGAGFWGRHVSSEDKLSAADDPTGQCITGEGVGIDYGCGAAGPDSDWQALYDDGGIQTFGMDTSEWPFKIIGSSTPEIMSYCQSGGLPTKWISSYRWSIMHAELATPIEPAAESYLPPAPAETKDFLQVSGWVSESGKGALAPVYRFPGGEHPFQPGLEGPYSIELLDAKGGLILKFSFLPIFVGVEGEKQDPYYFTHLLPYQEGIARVLLKLKETILDSIEVSNNPPSVQVMAPNGGETWEGMERISWEARDPDGDRLIFRIQYSPDGGIMWIPVAARITETYYDVDTRTIPGSNNAMIRVIASDGFNVGKDESDKPFKVAGKAPRAIILQPQHNAIFNVHDPVVFHGKGVDLEDVVLPESAYSWSSSVDGALGSGSRISSKLSPGTHRITLSVEDSDGNIGKALMTLFVRVSGCVADFNGDGDVDGKDLAKFADNFPSFDCGADCVGDFDGDGNVNQKDVATLAVEYGRTDCPR